MLQSTGSNICHSRGLRLNLTPLYGALMAVVAGKGGSSCTSNARLQGLQTLYAAAGPGTLACDQVNAQGERTSTVQRATSKCPACVSVNPVYLGAATMALNLTGCDDRVPT